MRARQKIIKRGKIPEEKTRSPVRRVRRAADIPEITDFEKSRSFSFLSRVSALLLFIVFLLQPFSSVFASEDATGSGAETTPQAEEAKVESIPLESESIAIEDATEESDVESIVAEEPEETSPAVVEGDNLETAPAGEPADVSTPPSPDVSSADDGAETEMGESGDTATSTVLSEVPDMATSTESAGGEMAQDVTEEVTEEVQATSSEEVVIPEFEADPVTPNISTTTPGEAVSEEAATTTEEVTVVMPEVTTSVTDENRYQFAIDECVTVEDGFFYCTKPATTTSPGEDRVYSAQDEDGDFEIFISKGGVDTQITHNRYDDSAPQYDPESERLVWHALIDDRYQVVMYDLDEEQSVMLTSESYNSMEPAVSGDRIVWQAWMNGNWEIILEEDGERTQLTENTIHDIDPHIRGELLSWQFLDGEVWKVKIYNIETAEVEVLEGVDGASVANPRFLLVYDNKAANGDVETVGFDLERKVSVPLSAIPGSVPKKIPKPEHQEEESAFVQTNPNVKEDIDADTDGTGSTTPAIGVPSADDEEVSATTTPEIPDEIMEVDEAVEDISEDPTAHIEPVDMSIPLPEVEEEVAHIPDVIVPIFDGADGEVDTLQ